MEILEKRELTTVEGKGVLLNGVYSPEEERFISQYLSQESKVAQLATNQLQEIITLDNSNDAIVCSSRANDYQRVNKAFEACNRKLVYQGLLIGSFESKNLRKKRILSKYIWGFNYIYYTLDFILKRVFPKFTLTKKLYFFITKGRNRVMSTPEVFGRLYSCGFEHIDDKVIKHKVFFVFRKIKEPTYDMDPTYGPLITLNRIGYKGKLIKVYKFRTMHPYAEYLQAYIYKINKLQQGGKFADDFRITSLGKIMRKFWIDELPMIFNFLKGELKLVGVRPISAHYYGLYSKETQEIRIKAKPGLVPPFYADMPKTLDEIQKSEVKYTLMYLKHPIKTDLYYLYKAFCNIVLKSKRSA